MEKEDGTFCRESATQYMAALPQKNKRLSDTDGPPEAWEGGKKIKKILKEAVGRNKVSYRT